MARKDHYPQDIIDDADSREPWKSPEVREWYMEGRMVERESNRAPSSPNSGEGE